MSAYRYQSEGGFFSGASLSNAVRMLIAWNVIFFLLQLLTRHIVDNFLELTPSRVLHGEVWRLASYLFLHGGFMHLLFNMLALWMFGSELEYLWGTTRFVKYYFFTGIGAGVCSVLVNLNSDIATIGASGSVFGLLLAYGMTFPNRPILLYFILPIPAKYFVALYGLLELFSTVFSRGSGVAHYAHLGGLLFGWLFLKGFPGQGMYRRWKRDRMKRKFKVLEFRDAGKDDWGRPTGGSAKGGDEWR